MSVNSALGLENKTSQKQQIGENVGYSDSLNICITKKLYGHIAGSVILSSPHRQFSSFEGLF